MVGSYETGWCGAVDNWRRAESTDAKTALVYARTTEFAGNYEQLASKMCRVDFSFNP